MSSNIPRALLPEVITRWSIAGLRLLIVEGPYDRRFVRLVFGEGHCDPGLSDTDVWSADSIEIPSELLRQHSIGGVGAKQRVLAALREIEALGYSAGFRGVVDRDLDAFTGFDARSAGVLYTDYSCMDVYAWTEEVFRRLLVQFRCEARVATQAAVGHLYQSIGQVGSTLAAIQLVIARLPDLGMSEHRSDKCLSVVAGRLQIDRDKYVAQTNPRKGKLATASAAVAQASLDIGRAHPREVMNGAVLLWLLTFVVRHYSSLPRHNVDETMVSNAMVAFGVMNPTLPREPMFELLRVWSLAGE